MKTILILLIAMITNGNKETAWSDNIKNSDNSEYVEEVAFNLDIPVAEVTQEQFNSRYLIINK